jgi:hypothetical protein
MDTKLFEHRQSIAKNQAAYTYEIEHNLDILTRNLLRNLTGIKVKKHGGILSEMIVMLFDAQDKDQFFMLKERNCLCVGIDRQIGIKII